jgi:glycosyltransferase involved in cell wall biosynthesis
MWKQTNRALGLAGSRFRDWSVVVHGHRRWDWVWQRPQQLLSRLARRHRVLFVEMHAPSPHLASPQVRLQSTTLDGLTLAQVQFPESRWADAEYVDRERRRLIQAVLSGPLRAEFQRPVQWFYDPMAVTAFAGHLDESAIVYDCMEEVSQCPGAPEGMVQREVALLHAARVVFTAGRRLLETKRRQNPNCHFYGGGVDAAHFGRANSSALPLPADLAAIPAPRLGYIGVVDERLDYELIDRLAAADPHWHVVMVGPTARVDPGALPRRPNLHWLGGRSYPDLPAYLKGFEACLLPFALNEATEFINPSKALEYLATARPVVSTALPDVVSNFAPVRIAHTPGEFVELCREALAGTEPERLEAGVRLARNHTWEEIVEQMELHIEAALRARPERRERPEPHLVQPPRVPATAELEWT